MHFKLNDLNRIPIIRDLSIEAGVNDIVGENISISKLDWKQQ